MAVGEAVDHLKQEEAAQLRMICFTDSYNRSRQIRGKHEQILMTTIAVGVS